MLIGTMEWASTRTRGLFICPRCGTNESFRLRASRPFLTLYFIPVVPIGGIHEFVQCSRCKNAFEPVVLADRSLGEIDGPTSGSKEAPRDNSESDFDADLLKVLALMMVEDGHVTENEIGVARRVFKNMREKNLSREDLGRSCSQVRLLRLNTLSFLATAGKRCSHEQKMLLVQGMFAVAGADGEISPGRMASLVQAQKILELEEREFQMSVEATQQWLS